jgi:5'-phosphate synthase pdxT subunit
MRVGVIAIQGDFAKHLGAVEACGAQAIEVRTPEQLETVDRAIIPGGESTTVGKLMERYGLGEALIRRAHEGMPLWGTCMGLILMASEIEGSDQYRLGLLDVCVRRNAFGAQVNSFEDSLRVEGLGEPLTAVFIRAPIVTRLGRHVDAIATYHGQVVGVRQGALLGTSFHPELTEDLRLHRWFLDLRS